MKKSFLILIVCVFVLSSVSFAKEGVAPKGAGQKIFSVNWSKALKTGGNKKKFFPDMSSPVFNNGRVYVGTHAGILYALNATDGKLNWQVNTNGPVAAKVLVDDDLVIVGNNKGLVCAFDVSSGRLVWQTYVGGEVLAGPIKESGLIIIPTSSREIYALNRENGKVSWSQYIKGYDTKFTMRGNTAVTASGGRLFVGFADGSVVSLSASNGGILWNQNLSTGQEAFRDIDSNLIVDGSTLYAVGYFGNLVKLNSGDGHIVWKRECRSGADMAFNGNDLFVSTMDGHVVSFDKENGQRQWDIPLYSGTLSAPHIQGNTVVVGSNKGVVYVLAAQNGQVLQTISMASGYMGQGDSLENGFFILSASARLYAFGTK